MSMEGGQQRYHHHHHSTAAAAVPTVFATSSRYNHYHRQAGTTRRRLLSFTSLNGSFSSSGDGGGGGGGDKQQQRVISHTRGQLTNDDDDYMRLEGGGGGVTTTTTHRHDDTIEGAQIEMAGTEKGEMDDGAAGLPPTALLSDQYGPRSASIKMEMIRSLICETLSAAVQVYASVGASQLYARGLASQPAGLLMIAFAQFFSYMASSFVFSPHSEGFGSPLLLWASVLIRHPPTVRRSSLAWFMIAVVLPIFQLLGSIGGALLADWTIGRQMPSVVDRMAAVPQVLDGANPGAAFLIEAIAAFWLILVMSLPQNTARLYTPHVARREMGGQAQSGDITRPIVAGFVFSGFVFTGGIIVSGVSISPWRWLGSAIALNFWTDYWWVHLFGPTAGFIIALVVGVVLAGSTK